MRDISEILSVERIRDISATTKDDVLIELCDLAATASQITDPDGFLRAIRARERAMSTGIGMGVAIPHAKIPSVQDFIVAVGRSIPGVDFDSLDGLPVHVIILVGASDHQSLDFLKLIGKIGAIFNREGFISRFLAAEGPEEMLRLLIEMT
jgi:mannitol/fructose-specific phosphotransferase system IIA component (Ntr-type)